MVCGYAAHIITTEYILSILYGVQNTEQLLNHATTTLCTLPSGVRVQCYHHRTRRYPFRWARSMGGPMESGQRHSVTAWTPRRQGSTKAVRSFVRLLLWFSTWVGSFPPFLIFSGRSSALAHQRRSTFVFPTPGPFIPAASGFISTYLLRRLSPPPSSSRRFPGTPWAPATLPLPLTRTPYSVLYSVVRPSLFPPVAAAALLRRYRLRFPIY